MEINKIMILLINIVWVCVYIYTVKSYNRNYEKIDIDKTLKQDEYIFNEGFINACDCFIKVIEQREIIRKPMTFNELETLIRGVYKDKKESQKGLLNG